ncbi:MAG: hypothetical protein H0W62_11595 [Chitinophagales bacterium]|nr:hypothetical protein [Chitinophagales bacterium]
MRITLLYLSMFIITSIVSEKNTCNQVAGSQTSNPIMPLAVGNFWVYLDSVVQEGQLQIRHDTLKIVSEETWEGKKVFKFSDGKEWYIQHDTIYQVGTQRNRARFSSPVFFLTNDATTFNYVQGGDVVVQKTISKIECPEMKWKSEGCYKISDRCDGYTIIAKYIGILRERTEDCYSGSQNFSTRTLLSFSTKR